MMVEAAFFVSTKTCASSKVAITGGAIRRPSWHWQVLSIQMSNDSYNRLTLGSAPPDIKNYTLRKYSVNDFISALAIRLSGRSSLKTYSIR